MPIYLNCELAPDSEDSTTVAQLASDLFLYSEAQVLQGPLPLLQQSSALRQPQQQLGIFSSPLHWERPKDLACELHLHGQTRNDSSSPSKRRLQTIRKEHGSDMI